MEPGCHDYHRCQNEGYTCLGPPLLGRFCREKRTIYYIPTVAHVWGNRTVEQPLTVFWTINKLYPEVETTEDLTKKISYFYSHFFQCELTGKQIGAISGA